MADYSEGFKSSEKTDRNANGAYKAFKTRSTLDDLAVEPRWVAWREESRTQQDGSKHKTKIPYDPNSQQQARIPTDPTTWGTCAEAKARWNKLRQEAPDAGGGVGIVLGDLDDGNLLMGIDLDCCPKEDTIEPWASEIIERFNTYAEVSPSGQGVKLFFLVAADDADAVKQSLNGKTRRTFAAGEHREIAIDRARFYAVTNDPLENVPETLRIVEVGDVRWFLEEAGPHYQEIHGVNSSNSSERRRGRDESGSGYGLRFMADCKKAGLSYAAARAAIRADDKEAGEWARRVDERQLERAWKEATAGVESIHSWDEPDVSLLDDRRGELPTFPIDALFPDQLQERVQLLAHGSGTSFDHVAVPLLGVASSLIGIARRTEAVSSWSQPMTCWAALVAYSGEGKTPGINVTRKALAHIEQERKQEIAQLKREHERKAALAKASKKKWEKDFDEAFKKHKPAPTPTAEADDPGNFIEPRLSVTDITVERMGELMQARPHGMLLLNDELGGWFRSMNQYKGGVGGDSSFWLLCWDGDSYTIERKSLTTAINIPHLLVGIVGGLQPDKIHDVFKGPADGMYARFLFAWPSKPPYRPLKDNITETDPMIVNLLDQLDRLRERKVAYAKMYIPLSPQAREAFERFRREQHASLDALDGREREWWAKTPAHVLRLAGTLSLMRWAVRGGKEPTDIRSKYVKAAVQLVRDYFWPHAQACLRQIGLSERHVHARRVLRWIRASNKQQVRRRDIRIDALHRHLDAQQTDDLLKGLTRAGWLRKVEHRHDRPGRPPEAWLVNPKLFTQGEESR
jgi:hypothetical protein